MNQQGTITEQNLTSSEDDGLSYGYLFRILLRRSPWILGAISISLIAATFLDITESPAYVSEMQLIVEPSFEPQVDLASLDSPRSDKINDVDYATQLNIMRSERFLNEAIARLEEQYPNLTINQLKKGFSLSQLAEKDTETRIFAASYTSEDSVQTQQVLQTLMRIYLEYNENQQQQKLSRGLDYIDKQLETTRKNLESAQTALERFRENTNIIDPSTQAAQIVQSSNELSIEKRRIQTDLAETSSRYQFLFQQLQYTPATALIASRLSQSEQVRALLNQLQATALELASRRATFNDADPTVKLLLEQKKNQENLLNETITKIAKDTSNEQVKDLSSYLQLGETDLSLISDFLLTNAKLNGLQTRLSTINELENELQSQISSYPKLIAEYDRLQPEIETQRQTLQRLLQERGTLTSELAKGGYIWQVIEEPDLGKDISLTLSKRLMLGMVGGLFLGGVAAFIRDSMDTTIRTSDELRKLLPFPLLGTIPILTSDKSLISIHLQSIIDLNTSSSSQESIKIQRWNILEPILNPMFREPIDIISNILLQNKKQAIAITSGTQGEGKSTITVGLAYSLARMNQKVLVIDANLRHSSLNFLLEISAKQHGLSSYLYGDDPSPVYQELNFGVAKVDLLYSGESIKDPLLLLSNPRFQQLITKCRQLYDVILIDTPHILGLADTMKINENCDGMILVTRLGYLEQRDLNLMCSTPNMANVLGFIINSKEHYSNKITKSTYSPAILDK